jgi:ClpP class serine protease
MTPEKVHEIANGNIYTGETALQLGLIDNLGNLWDAIDEAGKLGGISGEPRVEWPVKKAPSFLLDLFNQALPPGFGLGEDMFSPVRVMYILKVR